MEPDAGGLAPWPNAALRHVSAQRRLISTSTTATTAQLEWKNFFPYFFSTQILLAHYLL